MIKYVVPEPYYVAVCDCGWIGPSHKDRAAVVLLAETEDYEWTLIRNETGEIIETLCDECGPRRAATAEKDTDQ